MFTFPTHFLVGAAMAYLFGFSMLFGALGGMLPDLDYFTPWHRGAFHSFVFAPITAAVVYALTRSRLKSMGAGIGFAAHSLADWMNYWGTMILWPFSTTMFSLDIATWDDPVANGVLSIASVLLIILLKKYREKKPWLETIKKFWR